MDQAILALERSYQVDATKGVELLRAYQRADLHDKYLKLRAELGYVAETSVLPLPTKEQTKAFVEYVATAHSWYKHLHHTNPTPFYFFLNPHVMMFRETVSGPGSPIKSFTIANKGDAGLFHYSTMPTMQYRENYGYWDYRYGNEGHIYSEYCGLQAGEPEGLVKINIPKDLVCCVGLTAQVHGRRLPGDISYPGDLEIQKLQEEAEAVKKKLHDAMEEAMSSFLVRLAEARRDF